jgi:acetyltransferase-like isoleucine patch superfamily enzyme
VAGTTAGTRWCPGRVTQEGPHGQPHPPAVLGSGVDLGSANVVGPYAVIPGPWRIGDGTRIGPHVAPGTPPEIRGPDHGAAWDGDLEDGVTLAAGVLLGGHVVVATAPTSGSGPSSTSAGWWVRTRWSAWGRS